MQAVHANVTGWNATHRFAIHACQIGGFVIVHVVQPAVPPRRDLRSVVSPVGRAVVCENSILRFALETVIDLRVLYPAIPACTRR